MFEQPEWPHRGRFVDVASLSDTSGHRPFLRAEWSPLPPTILRSRDRRGTFLKDLDAQVRFSSKPFRIRRAGPGCAADPGTRARDQDMPGIRV